MVEEVKEEKIKEVEVDNDNNDAETIESAGEVTTSPIVETNVDDKFVQLEQRVTSLEQRLNGQEQQQQQQQSEQDDSSNEQSENNDDSGDNSDGIESNEEIKKILGL